MIDQIIYMFLFCIDIPCYSIRLFQLTVKAHIRKLIMCILCVMRNVFFLPNNFVRVVIIILSTKPNGGVIVCRKKLLENY